MKPETNFGNPGNGPLYVRERGFKHFFKMVLATMVGFILSALIMGFLGFIVIIGLITAVASSEKTSVVSDNSVLHLDFNFKIAERSANNPLEALGALGFNNEKTVGLNQILQNLKSAKTDNRIKGIYLDASDLSAGRATIEEIRNGLLDFKKSGKFIIAYSEIYTQNAYYIASVADKIYLNPEGDLEFKGFSSQTPFFKGSLEKLEIEAQIIKVGTYKSAVEPFVLDKMSAPNREQVTSFVGSMYDHFLTQIARSRHIEKDSLFAIANEYRIQNAEDAVKYKLADALKYKDQILDELKTRTGIDKKKNVRSVSIADYKGSDNENPGGGSGGDKIAIVYANGEIRGGEGDDDAIGSERISRAIRKARTDSKIKAVVLRVNSPGGSALASDVIWREVVLTKKVKPIIVSMGDLAASGGYYIACAADSIFAQPNTITGSIGVFGIIPNMQKFFNNKLGMTFDGVKTGQFADLGSTVRPLTDSEKMLIQRQVNHVYDSFTKHVAEGRHKTQEYVNSIGQGRVWSGSQAVQNGLVDRLGSIDDAVRAAAKMAKLKNYDIQSYPALKGPFESFMDTSGDKVKSYFTRAQLGENYVYYKQLSEVLENTGVLTRLPYNITIK